MERGMMKLFMDNLFVVVSIALIVMCTVLLVIVSRYRRMRAISIQRERERALEQDAIQLARAKLKFRNILGKQGQKRGDPLWDLYGVDVPTDCRPG
jgi:hypothetical protein